MISNKKIVLRTTLPYGYQQILAKELGVSQAAISLVWNRKSRSKRIEEAIAARIGISPESLFGTSTNNEATVLSEIKTGMETS